MIGAIYVRLAQLVDTAKWRYLWAGVLKHLRQQKRCPCCGATASKRIDRKLVYSFERCLSCNICYKYPAETETEMRRYYQSEYGRNETRLSRRLPEESELQKLLATGFADTMLDYRNVVRLLRTLGVAPGARVLDFGASWGYGVWQLRQAGFDAEGFEISRSRAEFGQRLAVRIYQELDNVGAGFEVVYSSHVLEHVPNPLETLNGLLRITNNEGFVIAHTPSACAAFRNANPPFFHLLWGLNHPVLLSDEFIRKNWTQYPGFLSSGTDRHVPAELAGWDQRKDFTGALTQPELLIILRNQPRE